ncbi:hypothetical protein GCM10010307_57800 [Streptomyces vastus]|uniref:Uncharacterized protein n=1 Tax=Streptomyces vastus TaxID=285451 RepID=A0ABN3RCN5_9ACTN
MAAEKDKDSESPVRGCATVGAEPTAVTAPAAPAAARSCRRESEGEGDGEGVALLLSRSMTEHARVSRST